MANSSFGNFAAGLLGGLAQSRERKKDRERDEKEKKARVQLFELQMEREEQNQRREKKAEAAAEETKRRQEAIFARLGAAQAGGGGPASLTELLADPTAALELLQTGMLKTDDILKTEAGAANRSMMLKLIGGAGGPGGMVMEGLKVGPGGEMMPDFGLPQVTGPQSVDTPDGVRLRTFDPRTGAMVADLGRPKEEKRTPEEGGRISGLIQAQEIGTKIREQFISKDGSVNRALVLTSFGGVPGTVGRAMRNDMSIAVDAILRARTGAGVNAQEMKDVLSQFMPSPLDSDEGIRNKLDRFDQFVSGALEVATLPQKVRDRLKKSGGSEGVTDWNDLPP